MKLKLKEISISPLRRSGQAMVEVMLIGAVASVTALGIAQSMSTFSKAEKKFNLNSDWASLINSVQLYANNPTLCSSALSSKNFGVPAASNTLNLPNANDFSPYITQGKMNNSIYVQSINLITDPARSAIDQGDGTTEVPVYLQIKAKKVVGAVSASTTSGANPDLFSGYVGTGASAKGQNLIQFGIIVNNASPYQIQRCQSYEAQVACGDLNGESHSITESGHSGHSDPACQLNQSLTLNSDKAPGSSGLGQIQFGDTYNLGNMTLASTPDLISDNIATRNLAFTANSLVITGSTSSVGINPGASNLHVTGSTQVDGDGAGNVLQVKSYPLQSNSCTTSNCTILWTQTNLYPTGIYGCGCGSGLFMLSGGATCSGSDLLQTNLPDAPTNSPNHTFGSQLIWVGACSNFDQPQSISVTCCTPTWTGAPTVTALAPPLPTVTSILVTSGPSFSSGFNPVGGFYNGGDTIKITGTGYHTGMTATVGGIACTNPTLISSTQMSCVTPRLSSMSPSPHTYTVIVSNSGVSSLPNAPGSNYTYNPPTVSSVVNSSSGQSNGYYCGPNWVSCGNDTITINGTGFFSGMTATIGGASCVNPNVVSQTQMTCNNPAFSPGAQSVTVSNYNTATSTSDTGSGGSYTYNAPTVGSINPNTGWDIGGETVTISGSGFYSGMTATINGMDCTSPSVQNSSTMTCITPNNPSGAGGPYPVSVTHPSVSGATATTPNLFTYYHYLPPPGVTGISPPHGTEDGGVSVTITGSGFRSGVSAYIDNSSYPCTITNVTSNAITCTTAAHPYGGPYTVYVGESSNAGGVNGNVAVNYVPLTNAYYYDPDPPTVTGISPNHGAQAGGTLVTITGNHFRSVAVNTPYTNDTADVVYIDSSGFGCNITGLTSTSITCNTSYHNYGGPFTVTVSDGATNAQLSGAYTYDEPPPTVTSISPTHGSANGNTAVSIYGTYFRSGMTAYIDNSSYSCSSPNVVSMTQLNCTTVAHSAGGAYSVAVTDGTNTGSLANAYTYDSVSIPAGQGWCVIDDSAGPDCPPGTAHEYATVSTDYHYAYPTYTTHGQKPNNPYCGDYHNGNPGFPPQGSRGLGELCHSANEECAGITWCYVPGVSNPQSSPQYPAPASNLGGNNNNDGHGVYYKNLFPTSPTIPYTP